MDIPNEDERYYELAEKWANGSISPEEMKEYADWYNSFNPDDVLEVPEIAAPDKDTHRQIILDRIKKEISFDPKGFSRKKNLVRFSVAASVAVLLGAALYFFYPSNKKMAQQAAFVDKIPGRDGAILTMADGRMILLDTAKNGRLQNQNANAFIKDSGVLNCRNIEVTVDSTVVAYNTISTPRGRTFKIILPDGTNAWLNAASSINFPTVFTKAERSVTITGEVYFEVVHDATHPFTVKTGNAQVTVLGTHFDIENYSEEKTIRTTLLEGSVKVAAGVENVKIVPGQQAVIGGGKNMTVHRVDPDDVTAWVHGNLSMENVDIADLLHQISRWYDVDVEIDGALPEKHFFGMIDRNITYLSQILDVLSENGLKIKKDGNKIIVSPR